MKRGERNWVTAFLLLCMCFLSAVFAVQGSLLSTMIERFQLDAGRQGLANSLAFIGGIVALVGAFVLQGRWRKRMLVKVSVLICAAGLVLMWLSPNYAVYVAAWFITGFGLGLMDTLLSACMADLYTGRQAVIMMCMLHTAYGLSSVLSPMGYAALLGGGTDWKTVYLVIACVGIMLVLCAAVIARMGGMKDEEVLAENKLQLKQIIPALHKGGLLWLTAAIFFHGIFLSGLNTWANRYADAFGTAVAIPAQSCVFLGVMLSRMLMPFLPIRTDRYVLAAGFLGGAALGVGLLFANGWLLRAMLCLSSLLFGAMIPCIISIGCERQRSNTLLVTTGIMLALYLGQSISSPMIAALEGLFNLKAGMLLCAVCMVLCSLCCVADRRAASRLDGGSAAPQDENLTKTTENDGQSFEVMV